MRSFFGLRRRIRTDVRSRTAPRLRARLVLPRREGASYRNEVLLRGDDSISDRAYPPAWQGKEMRLAFLPARERALGGCRARGKRSKSSKPLAAPPSPRPRPQKRPHPGKAHGAGDRKTKGHSLRHKIPAPNSHRLSARISRAAYPRCGSCVGRVPRAGDGLEKGSAIVLFFVDLAQSTTA